MDIGYYIDARSAFWRCMRIVYAGSYYRHCCSFRIAPHKTRLYDGTLRWKSISFSEAICREDTGLLRGSD